MKEIEQIPVEKHEELVTNLLHMEDLMRRKQLCFDQLFEALRQRGVPVEHRLKRLRARREQAAADYAAVVQQYDSRDVREILRTKPARLGRDISGEKP